MSAPFPLDLFGEEVMRRDAVFVTGDRVELSRHWGPGPIACVIGCNPSTADAMKDDPTSLWWNAWFQLFGFGGYRAVNLYPFCTPSPAECRKRADWHKTDDWFSRDQMLMTNLPHVVEVAKSTDQVFACWGNIAWDNMWIEQVVEEIQTGVGPYPDLWCWGENEERRANPSHGERQAPHSARSKANLVEGSLKRRRKLRPPSRPWSPEEDAQLVEVNAIGLRVEYWPLALPDRTPGEMLNRRLELRLKPAPLI